MIAAYGGGGGGAFLSFGISSRLTVVTTCSPLARLSISIWGPTLQLEESPQGHLLILKLDESLQEQKTTTIHDR